MNTCYLFNPRIFQAVGSETKMAWLLEAVRSDVASGCTENTIGGSLQ